MAMDSDVLGLAIAQTMMSMTTVPPTPEMAANMQRLWKAVAKNIVEHIQENAEVPAGIPVNASGYIGATTDKGKVK
jgi:hypothetical protein